MNEAKIIAAIDARNESTLKPWVNHVLDDFGPDRMVAQDNAAVRMICGLA